MPSLIGNKPNQVPSNGDLGTMAFRDQAQFLELAGAQTVSGTKTFSEIITASKGVAFPATQVASADVNTLDDYEEGTWTPTASTNITGTAGAGTYTKVGRIVFCMGSLSVTAISGDFTISGLPFTNSSNAHYTLAIPYFPTPVSIISSTGTQVNPSASTITFYRVGVFSGTAQTCYFGFWYTV